MSVKFDHVLVTGGAGYCGSVLIPQMLDMGYRVTVYDIQYYGYNFLPLDNTNLTVIQGDIRDIEKLEPLMTDVNIDGSSISPGTDDFYGILQFQR